MAYNGYRYNYGGVQTQYNGYMMQAGFVPISCEEEARNYPVGYGNSVTFKDENAPYIYTKTMGSQFDVPRFEKYRLVKEDATMPQKAPEASDPINPTDYVLKTEFEALRGEIEALQNDVKGMRSGRGGAKRESNADS